MNEVDTFYRTLGLGSYQQMGLETQVVVALQATLIIFFVVSPIMGLQLAKTVANRTNLVLSFCSGMLTTMIVSGGVTYWLGTIIPEERLSPNVILTLCTIGGICLGYLVARYLNWVLSDPGEATWMSEFRHMIAQDGNAIDREKLYRMQQKKKKRKR